MRMSTKSKRMVKKKKWHGQPVEPRVYEWTVYGRLTLCHISTMSQNFPLVELPDTELMANFVRQIVKLGLKVFSRKDIMTRVDFCGKRYCKLYLALHKIRYLEITCSTSFAKFVIST